jgi:mxaJ protein
MLATTRPYYRSTYVVVSRPDAPDISSFDDERLRSLKIGVQFIGDDGANTPPAHALSRRGIIANVKGLPIYGDYWLPTPQSTIVDAVAGGQADLAFVRGPTAAYFAKREREPLRIAPVEPQSDGPAFRWSSTCRWAFGGMTVS